MRRALAALLVVAVLTSGCASVRYAIGATDERTREAFADPVRRTHLLTQAMRVISTASTGITCVALLAPTLAGVLACPVIALLADFITFEYVLEPMSKDLVAQGKPSLIGPYWETGPHADLGEFFTCGTTLTNMPTHTCRPAPAPSE